MAEMESWGNGKAPWAGAPGERGGRTAHLAENSPEVRMGAGNSGVGLQVPRCFFPSVCSTPCILLKGRLPALGPGSGVGVKGEEGHRGQENLDTPTDSTWAQGFDLTSC